MTNYSTIIVLHDKSLNQLKLLIFLISVPQEKMLKERHIRIIKL